MAALKSILRRAVKFGVTGLFVTACHAAYAATAIELNGWTPPVANGAAFVFSTLVSYLVNTRWSFSRQPSGRTFARFWVVCGLGFLQSVGIAAAAERAGLPYSMGILLIAVSLPPVSFLLHLLWTYRERAPEVPAAPVSMPRPAVMPRRRGGRTRRRPYQRAGR
jgi:putative flippase GtrA